HRMLEDADDLLRTLRDTVSERTGREFNLSKFGYHTASLDGDIWNDGGGASFQVAFPGTFGEPMPPPPWIVTGYFEVACDEAAARVPGYYCHHVLVDREAEVATPEDALRTLRDLIGQLTAEVAQIPAPNINDYQHDEATRTIWRWARAATDHGAQIIPEGGAVRVT